MTRPDGPLCTVDWLAEHADDPDVVLLEVAFMPPAKALYYLNGHIPGARYTFWKDLCWDETDRRFPEPDEMARRLESIGVSDDSTLVLIGDTIQFATYAYWVLTLTGLSHLATVLDGGRQLWEAQGRELTHDDPPPATNGSVTPGTPDTSSLVGRDDVLENLDNPGRVLTRTLIAERIWEASYDLETNLIDVYVRRLRRKLEREGEPPVIRTIRGTGYQLA